MQMIKRVGQKIQAWCRFFFLIRQEGYFGNNIKIWSQKTCKWQLVKISHLPKGCLYEDGSIAKRTPAKSLAGEVNGRNKGKRCSLTWIPGKWRSYQSPLGGRMQILLRESNQKHGTIIWFEFPFLSHHHHRWRHVSMDQRVVHS